VSFQAGVMTKKDQAVEVSFSPEKVVRGNTIANLGQEGITMNRDVHLTRRFADGEDKARRERM